MIVSKKIQKDPTTRKHYVKYHPLFNRRQIWHRTTREHAAIKTPRLPHALVHTSSPLIYCGVSTGGMRAAAIWLMAKGMSTGVSRAIGKARLRAKAENMAVYHMLRVLMFRGHARSRAMAHGSWLKASVPGSAEL